MLDSLLRILALARKEMLATFKDPRSQFGLIVPPILQCLIYGYAATFDVTHVPYAVLDLDRSAASRQLIAKLDGTGGVRSGRGTAPIRRYRRRYRSAASRPGSADRPGF